MSAYVTIEWSSQDLASVIDTLAQKQMRFAVALALTRTAQRVKAAEYASMKEVFDRPTNFTLNSLMLRPATKARQNAHVWFKDFAPKGTPAAKYLQPQVFGGTRSNTRFEGALRHAGVLGPREFAIPARGAPRDAHGNVQRGLYQKIMSDLAASRDASQNSKGQAKYFVGTVGSAHGVFFPKSRHEVKLLFIFTGEPHYEPRFPFFAIAERVQSAEYATAFTQALDQALATARR